MKSLLTWLALPTALAILLIDGGAALSQTVPSTPLGNPVVVRGQSGGPQSSACGNIPATPNQQIQVTQPFTSLRFQVNAASSSTLFVTGPGGKNHCVRADNFSGGNVEIPGLWDQGRYSVFVGEQGNGSHPFTLRIVQEGN